MFFFFNMIALFKIQAKPGIIQIGFRDNVMDDASKKTTGLQDELRFELRESNILAN